VVTSSADVLKDRVDKALHEWMQAARPSIASISPDLEPFVDALAAFVLDGGKRLRPAFCYWGYRAAARADDEVADDGAIVRAAAALELLQACALMHDDVLDRSDIRRGGPSIHRRFTIAHETENLVGDAEAFGHAAAILLGDLALVWADSMLTTSGLAPDALLRALPMWDAMRVEVMCGQYLDVAEQARGGGSVERALRVARYKAAKYTVERPLHLGAAIAGGDADLLDGLSAYGLPIGEAFQLRDDLLGVFGDPKFTGKPAGDDLREGKRTVLVAYATEHADDGQRAVLRDGIGNPDLDPAGVQILREVIIATGAATAVERLIEERFTAALAALDRTAMADDARAELAALATLATERVA
ncbi:MAG: geranylgeranyl diphosphate synthase, type, partial [Frankiaceae bacterium]|nr:geranylgeranyl diphosphate synthase, type [Frankiaceae bacterium]